jgi:hypothetical protein
MKNSNKHVPFALIGIFMLACATLTGVPAAPAATATQPPTASTPVILTEADIIEGIQKSLNTLSLAYAQNDIDLLSTVLDPENKPFNRFIKTRFKTSQESYNGNGIQDTYMVDYITQREYNLVQAHILYNDLGAVDWTFRELENGSWVLTEPTVEQTGDVIIKNSEYFTFRTYPWADDVNSQVEVLMQNARDRVEAKLGKVPDEKIEVEIIPTYGLYPFDDPNAVAYYSYNGSMSGEGDRMVIYSPNSYLFGWYYNEYGWEGDLENILTHEYTHMTHRRSFGNEGSLADWIVEGLAEYVDGIDRAYDLADAMENDALIPLADTTPGVVYKQDIAHIYTLEKGVSLAYAESESVVAYIVNQRGGFDAFWRLAKAYDDSSGNLDKALRNTFNMSQKEFEANWIAWLKDVYLPAHTK